MREVDEALARAYAQREQSDPPQGVPPAPHWPARARSSRAIGPIVIRRTPDHDRSNCNGRRSC